MKDGADIWTAERILAVINDDIDRAIRTRRTEHVVDHVRAVTAAHAAITAYRRAGVLDDSEETALLERLYGEEKEV